MTDTRPHAAAARVPRGVWMLGFVSLLMDTSSELIHALLPLYMVGALGASMLAVGLIEVVPVPVVNVPPVARVRTMLLVELAPMVAVKEPVIVKLLPVPLTSTVAV